MHTTFVLQELFCQVRCEGAGLLKNPTAQISNLVGGGKPPPYGLETDGMPIVGREHAPAGQYRRLG